MPVPGHKPDAGLDGLGLQPGFDDFADFFFDCIRPASGLSVIHHGASAFVASFIPDAA